MMMILSMIEFNGQDRSMTSSIKVRFCWTIATTLQPMACRLAGGDYWNSWNKGFFFLCEKNINASLHFIVFGLLIILFSLISINN